MIHFQNFQCAKAGDVSFFVLLFFGRDSLVLVLIVVDSLVSAG